MRDDLITRCFKRAFGKTKKDYREDWAWPNEDKGQWSPRSYLIIYHENCLPNDLDEPSMYKGYRKLEVELAKFFGFKVFIEPYNAAVSAVWKV
jgi:hypothetical protein